MKTKTGRLVLFSLLIAIQCVIGFLSIPITSDLSITFNMIPMAIAAIAFGPLGGLVLGCSFGLISFLQCYSILGASAQGIALLELGVNPLLLFLQRFLPRAIDGVLLGIIFNLIKNRLHISVSSGVTGFLAAFINTLLFMSALILLFKNTSYMQEKIAGRAYVTYVIASVGVQGLIELAVSTVATSAIAVALHKAGFIRLDAKK
ncbi:MAG: ECF transporter S component [Clostridia bacterium]|nr:ECF transporter S component [Clostridia bacterium]